ncbi:oligosaccharyl transferase, STT3 subunit [Thermococcus sp.]
MNARTLKGEFFKLYEIMLRPKYGLLVIVILASAIRLLPMRFKYLLGYDSYFHLAYIRYVLTHGWVNFFPYALGPWGYQVSSSHPFGFWMTPYVFYCLFHPLGASLYNVFRVTPVIFGVLTVVFVYLTVLLLYGKREALSSAFFLAVSFAHVFRSMAGYYRGDNYMLFWYSVALFGISLALSRRGENRERRRFLFYIIPALAAGFSAIFWEAYYPIFAFLLASAVFMALGSFIQGRDYFPDAIALVGAVVAGMFISDSLGKIFGYGMGGPTHALGKTLALEFGLHFGILNDVVLMMYLKYAIPVVIALVLVLFGLSKVTGRWRSLLTVLCIVGVVGLGFRYYGIFHNVLLRLFPTATVLEMRRTTLFDLWLAYGISVLTVPFFFIPWFSREEKTGDFVLMGSAIIQFTMMLLWARFLFIASMMVAILSGIGLVRVASLVLPRIKGKGVYSVIALFLILLIPGVTAAQGIVNTLSVSPIMNKEWEVALTQLGRESQPNDVIMTWWDHGHWVTYYAMRAPVAQGSPNKDVAEYYLGLKSSNYLMNLGVDYVIVSLDTVQKFGAVMKTAGVSGYAMVFLMPSILANTLVFSAPGYRVIATPGESTWNVKVNIGTMWGVPKQLWVERGGKLESVKINGVPTIDVYVYINLNYGYAVLMNKKAFETPLARLMFTNNYSRAYRLVYSDGGIVKIYKFVHPNVEITSDNGRIVFVFKNATGTSLVLRGYLDNGTLVYSHEFSVMSMGNFTLPENVNGSVVLRYAYFRGHTPLDRGVFRIEDFINKG